MKGLALSVAAGLTLAGCGWHYTPPVTAPEPRYPTTVHFPQVVRAQQLPYPRDGVQLVYPTSLAIVTSGSSSCPSVPDELVYVSRHVLRIHLATGSYGVDHGELVAHPPPNGICTADLGTTPMLVAIDPALIDVHRPVTVRIFYRDSKRPEVRTAAPFSGRASRYPSTVRFPGVTATERVALHGGAQLVSPTRLAIVTSGSSSCPSVPDELSYLSRHALRIHLTVGSWDGGRLLAHAPPSGVCTADYGTTPMLVEIDSKLVDVHRPLTVRFFYPNSKKPLVRVAAPLR